MTRRSCALCHVGDRWVTYRYRYCCACWRAIRLGIQFVLVPLAVLILLLMVIL